MIPVVSRLSGRTTRLTLFEIQRFEQDGLPLAVKSLVFYQINCNLHDIIQCDLIKPCSLWDLQKGGGEAST